MDFKKITIIGVGLIGGSLALALKKNGYKGTITGVGRNGKNLAKAQVMGIVDNFTTVHSEGVKDADLIVIAASVGQFQGITKKIAGHIKKGAIVTDVGSVKSEVIKKIEPLMPEGVFFVGSHPIAGKECSGFECATDDLFNNARCIITPNINTTKTALKKIKALWKSVGMKILIMTAKEHDRVFAAVSHMPHVVAYTLVNAISDIDRKMLKFGGGGLRDMTRIALSPEGLWRDICASNQQNILMTLKTFSRSLERTIKCIEKNKWNNLEKQFKKAREARKLVE